MNILSKIRALFTHKNEPVDMPLAAAEIRNNKVFLHPANDKNQTICIRASAVDICINPEGAVGESDFLTFRNKTPKGKKPDTGSETGGNETPPPAGTPNFIRPALTHTPYKTPMKTISFRVYPEEYETLMAIIRSNGYRKAEYLLACVHAAKKKSMETVYAQYYDSHQERRKADREAAKRYREEKVINVSV